MMLDHSVCLNEIDASLQELSFGNQKCDSTDDDDDTTGVMIPMCHPCFAGDTTIKLYCINQDVRIYHLLFPS